MIKYTLHIDMKRKCYKTIRRLQFPHLHWFGVMNIIYLSSRNLISTTESTSSMVAPCLNNPFRFEPQIFMAWLGIGAQFHGMQITMLPMSTSQCFNDTAPSLVDKITSAAGDLVESSSTVATVFTSTLDPVLTHPEM